MNETPFIPDTAPFSTGQRAWLNGFFAGMLSAEPLVPPGAAPSADAAAVAAEEDHPWHDPTLALDERMKLADGRPLRQRLMAAMGQLDCGQCGYLCNTYAESIASGSERDLGKCVPGGKPTSRLLKVLAVDIAPASASVAAPAAKGAVAGSDIPREVTRDTPAMARLARSEPLNRPGAEKQTQNVVLSLAGTGIRYEPGDSLGVWPVNNGEEVELVLAILRARGSEPVTLPGAQPMSVREALLRRCNLREPSDELLALLSRCARDDIEATRLARMAEDPESLTASGVHDVFDLLVKYRSARPSITDFVLALSALQPRLYSIASSLKCHPGEVHLTVAVVRYEMHERGYHGVASNFFAERLRRGARVPIYVQKSHGFALPADPEAPVIMVGPGTGIAPFRAFLQERAATAAPGRNWLFFGNTRRELDFLYRGEFEGMVKNRMLTHLTTAFSRDQANKIYVQDRIREHGAELWQWFSEGAHFYVCGDAQRMAADVERALLDVACTHGRLDTEGATQWLASITAEGRYRRDVY